MSQPFLPTVIGEARNEMRIAIIEQLTRAGQSFKNIVKASKRYDENEDVTKVRLKFADQPPERGDLIVEIPGKH